MTDDTVTPVDINDDLDAFENEFFQTDNPEPVENEAEAEDAAEIEDDSLAPDVGDDFESEDEPDESEEEEDGEDEEEDEEPEDEAPKPKKNRKTAKERIEELVAKTREAERREAELIRRLEQLESLNKEEKAEEKVPTLREQLPADAPNPDTKGEDGEPLYPLGEFDPAYIRDLTRFTIQQEQAAANAKAAEEAQRKELEEAQQEIQQNWLTNLEKVEEELPDIRERIVDLTDTFADLEPVYGEYLASTIMASELGPQIMYYLSQNIGEAQRIVASGPAAATLALGRLEAQLTPKKEEPKQRKKVSEAAPPPADRSRGSQGKFAVSPDTDDLDAFERVFYNKK